MFRVIAWLSILAWAYPAFIWYSVEGKVVTLWPYLWAFLWPFTHIHLLYQSEKDPADSGALKGTALIVAAIGVWVLSNSIEKHTISSDDWERRLNTPDTPSRNPFDPTKSFEQRKLYNEFKSTLGN